MYRVSPKRNGYIVLRKSDRKQVHKGLFSKKTDATAFMNELITKQAIQKTSDQTFVGAFEKFINEKLEVANNPSLQLTKKGVDPYVGDFNLRIKPFIKADLLLSDFNYPVMKDFLISCHNAGHKYKRLKRMVRNIKTFLNWCALNELNPNLSCLSFDFDKFDNIKPDDHDLKVTTETAVIDEQAIGHMLLDLQSKRNDDFKSAKRFALITMLYLFGLRRSEIKGLRPNSIDLEHGNLCINGVYLQSEGGYKKRTKNVGSFRDIDLNENGIAFFKWYQSVLKKYKPDTKWLLPAARGDNPMSDAGISDMMWSTYAEYGLAEIKEHNGHIVCISSPLKNATTKTFRHRLGFILIEAMNTEAGITKNYIKHTLGHTKFTTSQDVYGNHKPRIAKAKTDAKARVLGYDKLSINL